MDVPQGRHTQRGRGKPLSQNGKKGNLQEEPPAGGRFEGTRIW